MTLKHEHAQFAVWLCLGILAVVEVYAYGVPAVLAAPTFLVNTLWVWE